MPSRKKFSTVFAKPLCLAALAAPLLLAACTEEGPWPMPTGYTYEHGQYKAPPGPQPVFKKWEYKHGVRPEPDPMSTRFDDQSSATTPALTVASSPAPVVAAPAPPASSDSWNQAAKDLVSRLITDFGHPAEAVWLEGNAGASDAGLDFDKTLRAALQSHQVHLAAAPGAGPFVLHYSIADGASGRALLTITLMSGKNKVAEESGLYAVSAAAPPPAVNPEAGAARPAPVPGVDDVSPDEAAASATAPVKAAGMADDIEPGPVVVPAPPAEHRLNN